MIEPDLTIDEARLARITEGAVVARAECAIFDVRGAGSLDCLQGLLTNDLVKPGPGSVIYGALLTPKGMIVVDTWVLRRHEALTLVAPLRGRQAVLDTFARSLPPRLAQVTDRTDQVEVAMLVGNVGPEVLHALGTLLPEAPGRLVESGAEPSTLSVARPLQATYFQALLVGDEERLRAAGDTLLHAGVKAGDLTDIEASRILAGWPSLGAEIDQKTLPQEVRFDEIGGVSYTKGCYTGQETVARLHFRGHPNRELRGLVWSETLPLLDRSILSHGRDVGTIRSTLALPSRRLGLAPIRREVAPGDTVIAGGLAATVVSLPFPTLIEDAVG
jgi:folate-binding protein YgfZ